MTNEELTTDRKPEPDCSRCNDKGCDYCGQKGEYLPLNPPGWLDDDDDFDDVPF